MFKSSKNSEKKILITLSSLCAEGTPILVLEMCRWWLKWKIHPKIVILNNQPTDLSSEFKQLGIDVENINLPSKGYWRYGQLVAAFYKITKQFKPDGFLSMPLGWHTFMAYGVRLAGVKKIVAHVGNYPPYWTNSAFRKFRMEIQLGRPVTNKLICCSDYVREGVVKHFNVGNLEAVTVYNGCPIEEIAQRAEIKRQQKSEQPFVIGMVARLERHKDQPTLIKAARILKEKGISFVVQLVGEGSRRVEYEKLIKHEGVEDCVQLLGMRRDIPELLGQTDVFVFSAKPDEGLGIALIEAMAAEVAIVATDVGACREVLEQGNIGYLVTAQDPEALADAIAQVMKHPEAAQIKVKQAKQKVLNEFSIENMAKQYISYLNLV
ncbi:glycosyltransferase [Pleurocapsa sp. FMAR1]|uniref:glycosyltransferase n=1 Tax=Pleurocapsa sp. FMAR1 TaxID=3040204 RepID=UPI0029C6FA85|nr:glycosyltransferase [Pleurocapsa sp. FMAR1]